MEEIPQNKKESIATDQEIAFFFSEHIDNPCEVTLPDGRVENIRQFYINQALDIMQSFTNIEAKKMLQDKINEYKK